MPTIASRTTAALDRIVAERQAEHRVPGIAAAVARGGAVLWDGGAGTTSVSPDGGGGSGEKPGPDTQFRVASISKTFTAVLVMALRDAGRLSLDDTVDRHLPESRHTDVTVRQLLAHVSGMPREPRGDVWDRLVFPDRADLVAGWNEVDRVEAAHRRCHYSNLGYAILGEVVARAHGGTWFDAVRSQLLEPLGLTRTSLGFDGGPAAIGYFVPPFSDVPVPEPDLDVDAVAPAAALASTTADLAAWTQFLAEGHDDVLAKDTLEEMCQPQVMADLERWRLAFGLGLMLVRVGDRVLVGHSGGFPGHVTGMLVHRPSSTAGIALMSSTSAPDPLALAADLAVEVLDHDPAAPEPWVPGAAVPDELAGLLGVWFSEGQEFRFSVRRGVLEARLAAAPSFRPPAVFRRVGDDAYRTESGREAGEPLLVTRDADGVPVALHWATYRFTREPLAFGA